jgi:hypothetical protein
MENLGTDESVVQITENYHEIYIYIELLWLRIGSMADFYVNGSEYFVPKNGEFLGLLCFCKIVKKEVHRRFVNTVIRQ